MPEPQSRLFATEMVLEIRVSTFSSRAIVVLASFFVCTVLLLAAVMNCAVGLLTDPRLNVSKELLETGARFVTHSGALNTRLAEAELDDSDRDLQKVDVLATRAVNVSPWDYRPRLVLARVKEAEGDRTQAERVLQEALELAPNYPDLHWRLANLFLREGKLSKAIPEFRAASNLNDSLLPGTIDLLWRVSGNLAPLQAVTPRDPKSQLLLSQFLLKQSRPSDAITIISGIDRNVLVGLPQTPAFIDSLIASGRIDEARGLWVGLVSGSYAQPGHPLLGVWNGSFESDISKSLAQFDWNLARNEYATSMIDVNTGHSGSRSLRIDFAGRDTTKVDGQAKQTLIVRPGSRYRLECYLKTERFESPEGPRLVIVDLASSAELAGSEPIASGSQDWRLLSIDFSVPATTRAVAVTIRRIPKYSFDKPTRGSIWFDDFVLTERGQ
jgi:tetratricopeptide (TPR) repeat protein